MGAMLVRTVAVEGIAGMARSYRAGVLLLL